MEEAKISEIFLSYQGEGPFAGSRQLFVRFFGCNLDCIYCDTKLESYKSFTKEALLGKILDFDDEYNELVLTGGEPLRYADFLAGFLGLFRSYKKNRVYLETNGTLPEEFRKIADLVDVVAMDVKLPSSTGHMFGIWDETRAFAELAAGKEKELVIKAVVTDATTMDDIKHMGEIIARLKGDQIVVLQPVTPVGDNVRMPDDEIVRYFKKYLAKETGKSVMVLGQIHRLMGVR